MLNKSDLIKAIATSSGISQEKTKNILELFVIYVTDELQSGGSVQITGFGSFEAVQRPERPGTNPRTGEATTYPAKQVVRFKAGKTLKDAVG